MDKAEENIKKLEEELKKMKERKGNEGGSAGTVVSGVNDQ